MNHLSLFAQAEKPHVSIAAEKVFEFAGFPITNSLLVGILGYVILFSVLGYVAWAIKNNRKRTFIVKLVEWAYEALYGTIESIAGDKKTARSLAPLPITLFLFIMVQYYLGILPVIGPIVYDDIPIFRSYVADLNTTFGLAIVTIIAAEFYAFKVHGIFGGINRYLRNPLKDPIGAFEGVLEIVAQMSRGIALSMRLFGNVFAGEVLLIMIAFLAQNLAAVSLPFFYLFELFIGAIQAYIFFMLTTIFISLGMSSHDSHDESTEHVHSSADSAAAATDRG